MSNYWVHYTTEQSVRGLRHGQYRPDLIICDDVEDLSSVKTKEARDKTFQFITGEVIPAGDQTTRLIVIGNLLHEDSLLMRLKKSILEDKLEGTFKAIPLLGDESKIVWPGKFPTMKEINVLKKNVASESAWQREYLLKIISDTDRLVHPEWIHYYEPEFLPAEQGNNFHYTATGVDVAISQRETADFTAMVSGKVFGYQDGDEDSFRVYILPHPVNEKLTFPQQVDRIKLVSKTLGNYPTKVFIEDVGYQAALIQHLENAGFPAEGVKTGGQDKRARLALTTAAIQSGKVLFPSKGCEDLILQLTGFGVEKHDDLADAFAVLMLKVLSHDYVVPRITWIDWNRGGFNFDDDDDFGMSGNWTRLY